MSIGDHCIHLHCPICCAAWPGMAERKQREEDAIANAIAKREREACAKVAADYARQLIPFGEQRGGGQASLETQLHDVCLIVAERIRARRA